MHRLPNESVVRKYRLASLMVIISFLGMPVAISILIVGMFKGEVPIILVSAWCMGGTVAFIALTFIVSARLRCPLCMVPPLIRRGCSKHRHAKKLFGSYRLKVAYSILFADRFRCPYCGEPTAMEARRRGN